MVRLWNNTPRLNLNTRGEKCHNGALSTTNPMKIGLRLSPGLRGDRRGNNRLSHIFLRGRLIVKADIKEGHQLKYLVSKAYPT